jgi:hypothetical protein
MRDNMNVTMAYEAANAAYHYLGADEGALTYNQILFGFANAHLALARAVTGLAEEHGRLASALERIADAPREQRAAGERLPNR